MNRPEIPEGPEIDFVIEAFGDLSTCRREGGSIPYTDARLYALDHGLSFEAFRIMWSIIRVMDAAAQKWHRDNPPPRKE